MRKEVNPDYMGGTWSDRGPEAACLQGPHEEGLGSHNSGDDGEENGVAHISENRHTSICSAQDIPHCLILGAKKRVGSRCHRKQSSYQSLREQTEQTSPFGELSVAKGILVHA